MGDSCFGFSTVTASAATGAEASAAGVSGADVSGAVVSGAGVISGCTSSDIQFFPYASADNLAHSSATLPAGRNFTVTALLPIKSAMSAVRAF